MDNKLIRTSNKKPRTRESSRFFLHLLIFVNATGNSSKQNIWVFGKSPL